ncbi:MAG: hypothetical protein ACXWDI_00030 [Nocardioides sp.]
MSGWAVLAIVAAITAALFALAWWHSGRKGPTSLPSMSETEKDYLSRSTWGGGKL